MNTCTREPCECATDGHGPRPDLCLLAPKEFFVHYTVAPAMTGQREPMHRCAGPYGAADVRAQQKDIAGYVGISKVFVSESRDRPTGG